MTGAPARIVPLLVAALFAAACGAADRGDSTGGQPIEVIVADLNGPTQFVFDGETIIVAQLNGGENDGTGQILEIGETGTRSVLYDNLDKPTGVLVRDDEIWIIERSRLSRGPRAGGSLTVVADDLPNNGRSQGTLTLTPDNDVLFNTSGSARGGTVVDRSGRLWTVGDGDEVIEYASGFKPRTPTYSIRTARCGRPRSATAASTVYRRRMRWSRYHQASTTGGLAASATTGRFSSSV